MQNIIYCPVCGTNIRFRKFCPGCRYELARDYEMFPTLGSIPGNMVSVPAQRQNWEKQQLQESLNKLLQSLHSELQEARQAKQEAAQAKKHAAELEKRLLRLEEAISSGRIPSSDRSAHGTTSNGTSSAGKGSYSTASSTAAKQKRPLITIKNGTCTFGSYPQGADGSLQPIQWRVLEVDQTNHKALLLSDKILDCRPYYTVYQSMNWEKAGNNRQGLRYWLNHEFFKRAFRTDEEQSAILLANVVADANPNSKNQANQGTAVLDQVFLLSAKEVIRYFANSRLNILGTYAKVGGFLVAAQGTEYAKKKTKLHQESNGKSRWWLRSVGNFGYSAAFVRHDGDIDLQGISVISDFVGIRPALWVDLRA